MIDRGLARGLGLWLVLAATWLAGRMVVSRIVADWWGMDRGLPVEVIAVATAQWLVLLGWRRRPPGERT